MLKPYGLNTPLLPIRVIGMGLGVNMGGLLLQSHSGKRLHPSPRGVTRMRKKLIVYRIILSILKKFP